MKIRKFHVKVALKLIGKKQLKEMLKLSKEEFAEKVNNNQKAKEKGFTDDLINMMYDELHKNDR